MAKKQGSISNQEKQDEMTKASLCLLEKKAAINKYRKKKKVFQIQTSKGVIETTDPEKWESYAL